MKRFVLKCILLFFLCFTPFYFRIDYNSKRAHPNSYYFAQIDKLTYLKNSLTSPAQRIIFIGGSNLAFGLNSEMLESELEREMNTDITVINMGLHAGIGFNRIIEYTLPYLRENDILLMAPEYGQFSKQIYGDGAAWFTGIDVLHIPLLKMKKWGGGLKFPDGFMYYLSEELKAPIYGTDDPSSVYRRDAFNAYGDCIGHLALSYKDPIAPHSIWEHDMSCVKAFMHYYALLRDRNVTVIFSYPCCQKQTYKDNKKIIMETDRVLRNTIPCVFIGEPQRYIFDDSFLYDTPFHLNAAGREKRTLLVIEDLISYFKGIGN